MQRHLIAPRGVIGHYVTVTLMCSKEVFQCIDCIHIYADVDCIILIIIHCGGDIRGKEVMINVIQDDCPDTFIF